MNEQHDQDASPGYMGPEGLGQTSDDDTDENRGALGSLGQAVKDLVTGNVPGGAQAAVHHAGEGMDAQMRRDTGMATADVENDPYDGSAGSEGMDLANRSTPDTDAHYPLDPRD